jgi:hypothetical protein
MKYPVPKKYYQSPTISPHNCKIWFQTKKKKLHKEISFYKTKYDFEPFLGWQVESNNAVVLATWQVVVSGSSHLHAVCSTVLER